MKKDILFAGLFCKGNREDPYKFNPIHAKNAVFWGGGGLHGM